jgi:dTDP-4-amino-4,6-dideoxygalactose transaminase
MTGAPLRKNSFAELAIAGAPAAFAEPVHVGRPNLGDRSAFLARVNDILDRRWLTNQGPYVAELEARICALTGARHAIAMCNATVALEIAVRAAGLHGEVIVPSYTFIATAHALQWQEITPVFADIDPATHTLDPAAVERMITPRTTGIIGVHLWGRPCAVDALEELCRRRGLKLLFDAAHALGCAYGGRAIGTFGLAEVLSFHATKFVNALEGGAVVTDDAELAGRIRLMKNFGFSGYDRVTYIGTNGKMTEIQAAMAITNLEAWQTFVDANRANYEGYRAALAGVAGVSILPFRPEETPTCPYVVLELGPEAGLPRDALLRTLQSENVLARRYFHPGCHRMEPYASHFPHAGLMLPNTEAVSARVIVLPTGTAVDSEAVAAITDVIRLAMAHAGRVLPLAGGGDPSAAR